MAVEAGIRAIEDSGVPPYGIDLLIVSSVSGQEYDAPGIANIVQDKLFKKGYLRTPEGKVNTHLMAVSLQSGCNGFTEGLKYAADQMESRFNGSVSTALVIGVEAMSKILDPKDWVQLTIFGDGAGALLLQKDYRYPNEYGILSLKTFSDGLAHNIVNVPKNGKVIMDPKTIAMYTSEYMPSVYNEAVSQAKKVYPEIVNEKPHIVFFHQTGNRVVLPVAKKLGLEYIEGKTGHNGQLYLNYFDVGNTSSASSIIAFSEAKSKGLIHPKRIYGFVTIGVGFNGGGWIYRTPP